MLNRSAIILLILPAFIMTLSGCKKAELPQVTTSAITEIGTKSAIAGGNVLSDGGSPVIIRGVCFASHTDPSIEDNFTSEGTGTGLFTSTISGLSSGVIYFTRAYATNSEGTQYGVSISFTTLGAVPYVSNLTSEVTTNTAIIRGKVNPGYLSTIVTFEYGTSTSYGNSVAVIQNPLTGSLDIQVSTDISSLTPGTTYHFRIKSENDLGIVYSSDQSFTTLGQKPGIAVFSLSGLTTNSVVAKVVVNPNYLSSSVFVEYGQTDNFGSMIVPAQSPLAGNTNTELTTSINNLLPGTKYYIRIKSINELGTTYSSVLSCTTFNVIDIDNNGYYSVKINSQEWISENLRVTHFQNGDPIPNITSGLEWSGLTYAAYCIYKNEPGNASLYGNIYNFYVARDTRNVCPAGWHIPSLNEWHTLVTYLGGDSLADEKLREEGTAHWINDTGASNATGFTILPAGDREADGNFFNLHLNAYIWSSFEDIEYGVQLYWNIGLSFHTSKIYWTPYSIKYGASIRCLKN